MKEAAAARVRDNAMNAQQYPCTHTGARLISGRLSSMLAIMRVPILHMLLLLILPFTCEAHAITSSHSSTGGAQQQEREARDILMGAKDALSGGRADFLREHLGRRVYINLFTGINGYYSGDQAYMILHAFFSTHTPISFSFSSRNFSIASPYGFGPLAYERRGRRAIAELFLSLARVDNRWVINQITVAKR